MGYILENIFLINLIISSTNYQFEDMYFLLLNSMDIFVVFVSRK